MTALEALESALAVQKRLKSLLRTRIVLLSDRLLAVVSLLLIPAVLAAPLSAQSTGTGDLDPSFGMNGMVTTDLGGSDEAAALAIQSDGKIVVAGMTCVGSRIDFALARYNADGSLDETFGDGGMVRTGFGAVDIASTVALQVDGKIVVAGSSRAYPNSNFALARYDVTGQLDPSFGDGGIVVTGFGGVDDATDLAIQPDGKIVAIGSSFAGSTCSIALARYNDDGILDLAFGDEGKVTTDLLGHDDFAHAIVQQPNGKLVVAGIASPTGGEYDFALARYTSAGEPDTSFGMGGLTVTEVGDPALCFAVALQRDGRIVVAGNGGYDFALARYLNDTPGVFRTWLPILTK